MLSPYPNPTDISDYDDSGLFGSSSSDSDSDDSDDLQIVVSGRTLQFEVCLGSRVSSDVDSLGS